MTQAVNPRRTTAKTAPIAIPASAPADRWNSELTWEFVEVDTVSVLAEDREIVKDMVLIGTGDLDVMTLFVLVAVVACRELAYLGHTFSAETSSPRASSQAPLPTGYWKLSDQGLYPELQAMHRRLWQSLSPRCRCHVRRMSTTRRWSARSRHM